MSFKNANFPMTDQGRTYHLNVKKGEIANRIITVGDHSRARLIASLLTSKTHEISSKRGFLTITGVYGGKQISIVGIGMGIAMLDFFIREARAVIVGPVIIIRVGSCGSISDTCKVGDVIVADSAILVQRNPDAFLPDLCEELERTQFAYTISKPFKPDIQLTENLYQALEQDFLPGTVSKGLNATADSFYSSQGRLDASFDDKNADLISTIRSKYPNAKTLEMETFMLFHLAKCSRSDIKSAACAMVFAERLNNNFISPEQVAALELKTAYAVLSSIIGDD